MSQLIDDYKNHPQTEFGGEWWLAKPYPDCFIMRLKEAWKVLKGVAFAVHYKEDEINTLNRLLEE